MKSWWYYFAGALSKEECQYVMDASQELPWHEGSIGHGVGTVVNKKTRDSNIKWLPETDPSLQWLFDRVRIRMLKANRENFDFVLNNEPYLSFPSIQFTQYNSEGQQHYDWHTDNNWIGTSPHDRRLSCVIQLNDSTEYEGGRLELDGMEIHEGKFESRGDMIIFPSHLKHRVTPVLSGARHSLVTWASGPRFR